jgi:UDP-2,3-diacylglucosamine pyrophosphatase LpxH
VHLRGDSGPFGCFLDHLAARAPARLVILGDLFDYWLETDAAVARHADALRRLRTLAAAGWRLDLVRGNRELAAGRRLEAASGCRLHWPRLDLQLGPARVRIVHGDRLCHDPGYRMFSAVMSGFWMRVWQQVQPPAAQDAVARLMRARSTALQARRHAAPRRSRVFIDRRRVQAAARGTDVLVAGHIHESWRRRVGGVDLILVGDWPGRQGRWVEGWADGHLERRAETL